MITFDRYGDERTAASKHVSRGQLQYLDRPCNSVQQARSQHCDRNEREHEVVTDFEAELNTTSPDSDWISVATWCPDRCC
jgi:hypothetical protein